MKTHFFIFFLFTLLVSACEGGKNTNSKPEVIPGPEPPRANVVANVVAGKFLTVSDAHIWSGTEDTTFFANSRSERNKIDMTKDSLWARTDAKIKSIIEDENIQFIAYLGDLPNYWHQKDSNLKEMLERLRNLSSEIPIFYVYGNNDGLEEDYGSFRSDSKAPNTALNLDSAHQSKWPILNHGSLPEQIDNVDFDTLFGYYSADYINPKNKEVLKVIGLNSIIFSEHEYYSHDGYTQQEAAQQQLECLAAKLLALKANDKLMILTHVPPGKDGFGGGAMWNMKLKYKPKNSNIEYSIESAFLNMLDSCKAKIVGLLTGHTHLDGFRKICGSDNSLITMSVSTPGIAVNHGNNPGFKVFSYDKDYNWLDYETHYAIPTIEKPDPDNPGEKLSGLFRYKNDSYSFQEIFDSLFYQSIYNTLDKATPEQIERVQKADNNNLYVRSNRAPSSFDYRGSSIVGACSTN